MSGNGKDVVDVPAQSLGLRVAKCITSETEEGTPKATITIVGWEAFAGYKQLQAAGEDWRSVLGLGNYSVTMDDVDAAYKRLARTAHPDAGGSSQEMARLNQARDVARAELGGHA